MPLNSTTPPPPPNLSLSLAATSHTVVRGRSLPFSVGIARTSLPGAVHLTVSGLPRGVGATFQPERHHYALERAGVAIETSDCFMFAASRFDPAIPHILGVARLGSAAD